MIGKINKRRKKIAIISGVVIGIVLVALFFPLVSYKTSKVDGNAGIAAYRPPADYSRGKLEHLPSYD